MDSSPQTAAAPQSRFRGRLRQPLRRFVWQGWLVAWNFVRPFSQPARLALLALALTPPALVCDYRLGLGLIVKSITYTPYAENNGLAVSYEQIFGLTQALWLSIGAYALARKALRFGYYSVTVASLALLLTVALVVTAALDGLDGHAFLALGSTLLPMIAMAGVLLHPGIEEVDLRRLIVVFTAPVALIVLGTMAINVAKGTIGQRFDLLLFGPPTDTGLVLAMTLVLLPACRLPRRTALAIAIPLLGGLALTQTRGALLALAAGSLALVLLLPHRHRAVLPGILVAIVVSLGAFFLLSRRSLLLTDESTDLRRAELSRHWQLFLARPSYGYGLAKGSAFFSNGAHNAVLGIANATGIGGALLWLCAWIQPVALAITREISVATAIAAGVLVCALVGWFTTGTELLLYSPPTNLLPLLLALALARRARTTRS